MSGSARAKETIESPPSDIFGKVVQLKKGVMIDRDWTSINLNEHVSSLRASIEDIGYADRLDLQSVSL